MFLKLYAIATPIFFLIDMIWLGLIAKNFYAKHLGYLMTPQVNWIAALIFYFIFIVGLVVFVITPGLKSGSFMTTISYALLFGLVTYATYDLTNLATIKNWPLLVTIIDLIWGMSLSTMVSVITHLIANKLGIK